MASVNFQSSALINDLVSLVRKYTSKTVSQARVLLVAKRSRYARGLETEALPRTDFAVVTALNANTVLSRVVDSHRPTVNPDDTPRSAYTLIMAVVVTPVPFGEFSASDELIPLMLSADQWTGTPDTLSMVQIHPLYKISLPPPEGPHNPLRSPKSLEAVARQTLNRDAVTAILSSYRALTSDAARALAASDLPEVNTPAIMGMLLAQTDLAYSLSASPLREFQRMKRRIGEDEHFQVVTAALTQANDAALPAGQLLSTFYSSADPYYEVSAFDLPPGVSVFSDTAVQPAQTDSPSTVITVTAGGKSQTVRIYDQHCLVTSLIGTSTTLTLDVDPQTVPMIQPVDYVVTEAAQRLAALVCGVITTPAWTRSRAYADLTLAWNIPALKDQIKSPRFTELADKWLRVYTGSIIYMLCMGANLNRNYHDTAARYAAALWPSKTTRAQTLPSSSTVAVRRGSVDSKYTKSQELNSLARFVQAYTVYYMQ